MAGCLWLGMHGKHALPPDFLHKGVGIDDHITLTLDDWSIYDMDPALQTSFDSQSITAVNLRSHSQN